LPKDLKEVSGNETIRNSNLIWMLNDGGNESKIYAVSEQGKIKREVYIKNKNHDWEDLTSDEKGNIYIGDFGNNLSKRKNLTILKIEEKYLKKEY
jgi:sugar lactone lactonase YvrE